MIQKIFGKFYQKLSRRERVIFFGTLIFLFLLFVDRFIVSPVMDKLSQLDRQIHDQETSIKTSLKVLVQKDRILAENSELATHAPSFGTPEEEMTTLLKDIESIANTSKVSLVFVKPGNIEAKNNIKRYYATLECESEMPDMVTFFHSVEGSSKLLKIERYLINPKNKESSIAHASLTISKTDFI